MTNQEQRSAIAAALGWRPEKRTRLWISPDRQRACPNLPDYPNDLNAMREAEEWLLEQDPSNELVSEYSATLHAMLSQHRGAVWFDICHATAAQKAEAFLRCVGAWKES